MVPNYYPFTFVNQSTSEEADAQRPSPTSVGRSRRCCCTTRWALSWSGVPAVSSPSSISGCIGLRGFSPVSAAVVELEERRSFASHEPPVLLQRGVQERVLPLSALEWPALVPVEGNALWFRHVALPATRECFYFVCTYRVVCNGEELSVPPWIAA